MRSALVNYLPNRFYLSSFNAPPPMIRAAGRVEEYLAETFVVDKVAISASITKLETIDLSNLPEKLADSISTQQKSQVLYSNGLKRLIRKSGTQ